MKVHETHPNATFSYRDIHVQNILFIYDMYNYQLKYINVVNYKIYISEYDQKLPLSQITENPMTLLG